MNIRGWPSAPKVILVSKRYKIAEFAYSIYPQLLTLWSLEVTPDWWLPIRNFIYFWGALDFISVKTPLFIPTVFLQLKIASNESILGLLFFESTFSGSKGYGSTSMSHTVWIILYDWHSWTYVCMLSDFCGINMLCTFRLVVYCFFNCIFKISECLSVRASITCYGSKDFWAGDSTLKF